MQVVHAISDDGPIMEGLTRWQPRRVQCMAPGQSTDEEVVEHVVKYRRATPQLGISTAAGISEIVCGRLMEAGGVEVPARRLVATSEIFVASVNKKIEEQSDQAAARYTAIPGLHFGTVRMRDVENGPPLRIEHLDSPQELVTIWAFDSWVCNIDREKEGNLLLRRLEPGRFHLIAADQSDCFCGSGCFADGSWLSMMRKKGAAFAPLILQAIFAAGAVTCIHHALQSVREAARHVGRAFDGVPSQWWVDAGISKSQIDEALGERLDNLERILNPGYYAGMAAAVEGGRNVL